MVRISMARGAVWLGLGWARMEYACRLCCASETEKTVARAEVRSGNEKERNGRERKEQVRTMPATGSLKRGCSG